MRLYRCVSLALVLFLISGLFLSAMAFAEQGKTTKELKILKAELKSLQAQLRRLNEEGSEQDQDKAQQLMERIAQLREKIQQIESQLPNNQQP